MTCASMPPLPVGSFHYKPSEESARAAFTLRLPSAVSNRLFQERKVSLDFDNNVLIIGDQHFQFDFTKIDSDTSALSINQTSHAVRELGSVAGRLVVGDESAPVRMKEKTEADANKRAQGQVQEVERVGRSKRGAVTAVPVAKRAKKESKTQAAIKAPKYNAAEVKTIVVQRLAVGPTLLSRLAAYVSDDVPKGELENLVDEVGTKDKASGKWTLLPELLRTVDTEWGDYTEAERKVVRRAVESAPRSSPVTTRVFSPWEREQISKLSSQRSESTFPAIRTQQGFEEGMKEFQRRYQLYTALDAHLRRDQQRFEPLEQSGASSTLMKEFQRRKDEIEQFYKSFMALHSELTILKKLLRQYSTKSQE